MKIIYDRPPNMKNTRTYVGMTPGYVMVAASIATDSSSMKSFIAGLEVFLQGKYGTLPSREQRVNFPKVKTLDGRFRKSRITGEIIVHNHLTGWLSSGVAQVFRPPFRYDLFSSNPMFFQKAYSPTGDIKILEGGTVTTNRYIIGDGYFEGRTVSGYVEYLDNYRPNARTIMEQQLNQLTIGSKNAEIQEGIVTECLASLNGKTLDVLTSVAELPESVNMIWDLLFSIIKLTKSFKRQLLKEGFKTTTLSFSSKGIKHGLDPQTWASLWLQYRYGIMPLIYQVEDILKAIEEFGVSEYVDERKKTIIEDMSPIDPLFRETVIHRVNIRRKVDLSTIFQKYSQQLSIDPFVTAWELVTLSFVIDWVLNVGDFLGSLSTPSNVLQEACTYSIRRNCDGESGSRYLKYEVYHRIIINPQSHTGLVININMSKDRYIDLAALIKSIMFNKKA